MLRVDCASDTRAMLVRTYLSKCFDSKVLDGQVHFSSPLKPAFIATDWQCH